ncbi:hypothetical protein HDV05_004027 [Chytridiales sp. JEL 0842]|nr:hypothetical protein HDV05_004027 [Chytridiales sp. JEL 0842]
MKYNQVFVVAFSSLISVASVQADHANDLFIRQEAGSAASVATTTAAPTATTTATATASASATSTGSCNECLARVNAVLKKCSEPLLNATGSSKTLEFIEQNDCVCRDLIPALSCAATVTGTCNIKDAIDIQTFKTSVESFCNPVSNGVPPCVDAEKAYLLGGFECGKVPDTPQRCECDNLYKTIPDIRASCKSTSPEFTYLEQYEKAIKYNCEAHGIKNETGVSINKPSGGGKSLASAFGALSLFSLAAAVLM